MGRYDYNRIFISDEDQEKIRNCRVFIGGAASGSIIAECALRLGFEKMTVVDSDDVRLSDLNRHDFTMDDIGHNKAEAVGRRLRAINPDADIRVINKTSMQSTSTPSPEQRQTLPLTASAKVRTSLSYIPTISASPHSSW